MTARDTYPAGWTRYPTHPADIDGATSELRRYQRAALARHLALGTTSLIEICRICDMNQRSLDRLLRGLSFADGPYPVNHTRRTFVSAMEGSGHVVREK